MTTPLRTYPPGVPSWIDTERADPHAAAEFYAELFGWTFSDAAPPDASGPYLVATIGEGEVAAIGPYREAGAAWNTYIEVDDAEAAIVRITGSGGRAGPVLSGGRPGERIALCADPTGAPLRVRQTADGLGAQVVNAPGGWNFSILHTPDPSGAFAFYRRAFGWTSIGGDPALGDAMAAVPGYGDHLAATADPGIYERQKFAPKGFADVVAGIGRAEPGEAPHWRVQFTVADRDETARIAESLGARIVSTRDTRWTLEAVLEDPEGVLFTASQFAPR